MARCSTTSSCGGIRTATTCSTSCPTPPTPTACVPPSADVRRQRASRARRPGTERPRAPVDGVARGGRRRALSRRPRRRGRARRARWPAPATPASAAWRSPCRPMPPRRSGRRSSMPASMPAGLGARDTLRLEAGLPLHGHELGPGITPLQAGLGWVVGMGQAGVPRPGSARTSSATRGVERHLVGIATEGRRPPRAECPVDCRRRDRRSGHERQLLTGARPRDRAWPSSRPTLGAGAPRRRSTYAAPCSPGESCRPRSSVADDVAVNGAVTCGCRRPLRCGLLLLRGCFAGAFCLAARFLGGAFLAGAFSTGGGVRRRRCSRRSRRRRDHRTRVSAPGCAARTARRPARPPGRAATCGAPGR